jgi:hypothetical protein
MASLAKWSSARRYASSMKSTLPRAFSSRFCVLGPVSPTYSSTRSVGCFNNFRRGKESRVVDFVHFPSCRRFTGTYYPWESRADFCGMGRRTSRTSYILCWRGRATPCCSIPRRFQEIPRKSQIPPFTGRRPESIGRRLGREERHAPGSSECTPMVSHGRSVDFHDLFGRRRGAISVAGLLLAVE